MAGETPVVTGNHRSGDPNLAVLGYEDTEAHPPKFEDKYEERKFLKHRLVLAYRIFAQHGLMGGIAGHITMRDPVEPTSFWVNPFGERLPADLDPKARILRYNLRRATFLSDQR